MKEFDEKHIKDLQDAGGFILQNVHGNTVAIGIESEYPDIICFFLNYIEEYGTSQLADKLSYENDREMLNDFIATLRFRHNAGKRIKNQFMKAFNGISADDYAKKLEEKQWHLGDVVEEEEGHKAMIVKDNEGDYVLMDIDPDCANAFQVSEFFECSSSLKRLRELSYNWHKVNAKLVIE